MWSHRTRSKRAIRHGDQDDSRPQVTHGCAATVRHLLWARRCGGPSSRAHDPKTSWSRSVDVADPAPVGSDINGMSLPLVDLSEYTPEGNAILHQWWEDKEVQRFLGPLPRLRGEPDIGTSMPGTGRIARPTLRWMVQDATGQQVGFVSVPITGQGESAADPIGPPFHAGVNLVVAPGRRKQGIGTAILNAVYRHPLLVDMARIRQRRGHRQCRQPRDDGQRWASRWSRGRTWTSAVHGPRSRVSGEPNHHPSCQGRRENSSSPVAR